MLSIKEIEYLCNVLDGNIKQFKSNEIIPFDYHSNDIGIILSGIIYLCLENEIFDFDILDFYRTFDVVEQNMIYPPDNGIRYFLSKGCVKIAFINQNKLSDFYVERPNIRNELSLLCLTNLKNHYLHKTDIIHQKSVRNKLLEFLRYEAKIQGTSKITLPIPYKDLALYLCVDRTTLMKELHRLKEDGIIAGKNHKLSILF